VITDSGDRDHTWRADFGMPSKRWGGLRPLAVVFFLEWDGAVNAGARISGDRPGGPWEGPARGAKCPCQATQRRAWEGPVGPAGRSEARRSCRPLFCGAAAQAFALEFDTMRIVNNAIEDGVG